LKNGYPRPAVETEIQKFWLYWTEPTPNGKKQRWQTHKTFEVAPPTYSPGFPVSGNAGQIKLTPKPFYPLINPSFPCVTSSHFFDRTSRRVSEDASKIFKEAMNTKAPIDYKGCRYAGSSIVSVKPIYRP